MGIRKFFEHDGEYAKYLKEERKVYQEAKAEQRRQAENFSWQRVMGYFIFFLTPKFVWKRLTDYGALDVG